MAINVSIFSALMAADLTSPGSPRANATSAFRLISLKVIRESTGCRSSANRAGTYV